MLPLLLLLRSAVLLLLLLLLLLLPLLLLDDDVAVEERCARRIGDTPRGRLTGASSPDHLPRPFSLCFEGVYWCERLG
jgi:hypothetical protein